MKLKNTFLRLEEGYIPFRFFTQRGEVGIFNNNYRLTVTFRKDLLEFQDISNGHRLTCDNIDLVLVPTKEVIPFDSFFILDDGRVQVNERKDGGYSIRSYPLEDLELTGYEYDPNEDAY